MTDKQKHIKVLKKIVKQGNCLNIDCNDCPFVDAKKSGWSCYMPKILKLAKRWVRDNEEKEMKLEATTDYKDPKWCLVRDSKEHEWEKVILIADNSHLNLINPYEIVSPVEKEDFLNGKKVYTVNRRYAKPIPEPQYKAYEKLDQNWIGETLIFNHESYPDRKLFKGEKYVISGIGYSYLQETLYIELTNKNQIPLEQRFGLDLAFKDLIRTDGTPFGELIKECADVANFAMMIAGNLDRIIEKEQTNG